MYCSIAFLFVNFAVFLFFVLFHCFAHLIKACLMRFPLCILYHVENIHVHEINNEIETFTIAFFCCCCVSLIALNAYFDGQRCISMHFGSVRESIEPLNDVRALHYLSQCRCSIELYTCFSLTHCGSSFICLVQHNS